MQRKNKGIVETINAVFVGLFVIGALALIYWFFISRILEIHTTVNEATAERHAINLANVLISSEKLAREDEGKILRGILDSGKLDNVFVNKKKFLEAASANNLDEYFQPKDIGIGYPNSLNLVEVIDLESCQNSACDGWIVSLSGPISLQGLSAVKFANCLAETAKLDTGSLFRYMMFGPVGALWQSFDIEKCIANTIPANMKSFFTGTPISSKGLPILIRYPDGDLHIGKIIVGVGEWA
jgi:hypothetical protein